MSKRLQGKVEQRDALREDLAEIAGGVGLRKTEPRLRLAGLGDDVHALPSREMHHRLVLLQAMHEELRPAPVARPQRRALQERTTEAAAAVPGEYRYTELGVVIAACNVRGRHQREVIAHHAEERVAVEVDGSDVAAH